MPPSTEIIHSMGSNFNEQDPPRRVLSHSLDADDDVESVQVVTDTNSLDARRSIRSNVGDEVHQSEEMRGKTLQREHVAGQYEQQHDHQIQLQQHSMTDPYAFARAPTYELPQHMAATQMFATSHPDYMMNQQFYAPSPFTFVLAADSQQEQQQQQQQQHYHNPSLASLAEQVRFPSSQLGAMSLAQLQWGMYAPQPQDHQQYQMLPTQEQFAMMPGLGQHIQAPYWAQQSAAVASHPVEEVNYVQDAASYEEVSRQDKDVEQQQHLPSPKKLPPSSNKAAVKKSPARKEKTTKPRDKYRPRRALSAYNVFFQEQKQILDEERKKMPSGEGKWFEKLAKIIGGRWKALPADLRKPYEELAAQDKKRYTTEKEDYDRRKAEELSQKREALEKLAGQEALKQYQEKAEKAQKRRKSVGSN